VHLGGMLSRNIDWQQKHVEAVNGHFDIHLHRDIGDFHDPMDRHNIKKPQRRFPYSANAYIISTGAARLLAQIVDEVHFLVPTFVVVVKLMDLMDGCYTARPMLVKPRVDHDV
jgi:hypothetical protein